MVKIRIVGGYIALVAFLSVAGAAVPTYAAEKKEAPSKSTTEAAERKSEGKYTYIAQPGDAYAQLVRKATQTYGILNNKDLGAARIVAIETWASEQAGWPMLNEGQGVTFKEEVVAGWVKRAESLTDQEVAIWGAYVPYVDFDTRRVGEQ